MNMEVILDSDSDKKLNQSEILSGDTDDELNQNKIGDSNHLTRWEDVTEADDIFGQIKLTVSPVYRFKNFSWYYQAYWYIQAIIIGWLSW